LGTKIKYDNLDICLFFLLALTSSFDIFMKLDIGGFNFRIFYLIEFILICLLIFKKRIIYIEFQYIMVWAVFNIIFIPNTTILTRSIGYGVWLILSLFVVILFSTIINKLESFTKVFRLYIYSFTFIALFGLIQFSLGLFGIDIYVQQWWIYKVLPRINGFSYEPSYYGSYLIIGWSVLLYLFIKNNLFFNNLDLIF